MTKYLVLWHSDFKMFWNHWGPRNFLLTSLSGDSDTSGPDSTLRSIVLESAKERKKNYKPQDEMLLGNLFIARVWTWTCSPNTGGLFFQRLKQILNPLCFFYFLILSHAAVFSHRWLLLPLRLWYFHFHFVAKHFLRLFSYESWMRFWGREVVGKAAPWGGDRSPSICYSALWGGDWGRGEPSP